VWDRQNSPEEIGFSFFPDMSTPNMPDTDTPDAIDIQLVNDIRSAFEAYLAAYFTRRDPEAVFPFLHESITGFGTGRSESTFKDTTLRELFFRDLQGAPERIDFNVRSLFVRPLPPDSGCVAAEIDISTRIAGQFFSFHDLRMSLLFHRAAGAWQIIHLHVSLPTTEHGETEAYPVKELEERNVALTRLVEERTTQLNAALRQQHELAVTDALTGLYNRRMLDEQLGIENERSQRHQSSFSVLMLDIDHFKSINDRFGHSAGDQFLIKFADLIRVRLRKADLAGRWGGEEFLVVCHGCTLVEATRLAEDIRSTTEAFDFGLGENRTVSIGVAQWAEHDTIATLIERADQGLYRAKQSGRNRVCATDSTS